MPRPTANLPAVIPPAVPKVVEDWSKVPPAKTVDPPPTGMPYPMCARCGRDVKRMSHRQDPKTNEIIFTVVCHGETEDIRMSACPIADGAHLTRGVAFQRKTIT